MYDEDEMDYQEVSGDSKPWEHRHQLGTHETSKDDAMPSLPEGYGFCCANGCGVTTAAPYQFYTYTSHTIDGEFIEGKYHKDFSSECCAPTATSGGLDVYELETDDFVSSFEDFQQEKSA